MSRFASPAPLLAGIGAAGLGVVTAVLPILGDRHVALPEHVLAFVLVLLPVSLLIYGILVIGADSAVWKLLFWGMTAGALGAAAAYFGGRPEELAGSTTTLPLMLLFLADALRIAAATYVGLVLARPFASSGIALLAAGLVAAVDLFSVFAGPTRTLVENGSPSLDYFLLWFPTFGRPLGFSLGVSDFVFLAAFTAMARQLSLRPLASLALACVATVLALLAAFLLARPLPALPFIAFSFILANIGPLLRRVLGKE
jgi:hypothetical protein